MTGSTLTALTTNPAPSPETVLISSVLYCPTFSSTVSTAAASATRLAWTPNFSSIVRHQSSVIHRPSSITQSFVPLRFAIIFYSKIINYPTL
jgi:hypothetical protein